MSKDCAEILEEWVLYSSTAAATAELVTSRHLMTRSVRPERSIAWGIVED